MPGRNRVGAGWALYVVVDASRRLSPCGVLFVVGARSDPLPAIRPGGGTRRPSGSSRGSGCRLGSAFTSSPGGCIPAGRLPVGHCASTPTGSMVVKRQRDLRHPLTPQLAPNASLLAVGGADRRSGEVIRHRLVAMPTVDEDLAAAVGHRRLVEPRHGARIAAAAAVLLAVLLVHAWRARSALSARRKGRRRGIRKIAGIPDPTWTPGTDGGSRSSTSRRRASPSTS
jgi:hypothetical protein